MTLEFKAWPKVPHLFREIVISEKINGSNCCIQFDKNGNMLVQSRTRIITPENDNHGFAAWAEANKKTLFLDLGPGAHFGEWWGYKIQGGYGCKPGERYFSLFNTRRYEDKVFNTPNVLVIPVLFEGIVRMDTLAGILYFCTEVLRESSLLKPGRKAEGVVIYHKDSDSMFKIFLEKDDKPKSQH